METVIEYKTMDNGKERKINHFDALYHTLKAGHMPSMVDVLAFQAYCKSMLAGNKYLNYDERIPDIPAFVKSLKDNGVPRFTYSSAYSDAIETAKALNDNGCKLAGTTKVMIDGKEIAALVFDLQK